MMIETVVTVGVSAWAWSLASASGRSGVRWSAATMAIAFATHRLTAWLVRLTQDPNDVFTTAAQLWRMVGPFSGSILVFVLAPIVLGLAVPSTPPRRR